MADLIRGSKQADWFWQYDEGGMIPVHYYDDAGGVAVGVAFKTQGFGFGPVHWLWSSPKVEWW